MQCDGFQCANSRSASQPRSTAIGKLAFRVKRAASRTCLAIRSPVWCVRIVRLLSSHDLPVASNCITIASASTRDWPAVDMRPRNTWGRPNHDEQFETMKSSEVLPLDYKLLICHVETDHECYLHEFSSMSTRVGLRCLRSWPRPPCESQQLRAMSIGPPASTQLEQLCAVPCRSEG